MGDIAKFPIPDTVPKCVVCGGAIVLTRQEREALDAGGVPPKRKCFCCERNLTLPILRPSCPDCHGRGWVGVHVCGSGRDRLANEQECRRKCPEQQQCIACLGTGVKK